MQAEARSHTPHMVTHTHTRSHTPFGCVAASTRADDRAIIHRSVPRGQGSGWTGEQSVPAWQDSTEVRGTRTFITLVVWGPGAFLPLSHSLCLCLHQINGPGPDRGSVSISTACQACPSPRQPLIYHGLDTHTHADMFIYPQVLWCKARPQVAMLSGYKLFNPSTRFSHIPPSSRDLIACLSMLAAPFLS